MRCHGNHNDGDGRPVSGDGKMYSLSATGGIEPSSVIAELLSGKSTAACRFRQRHKELSFIPQHVCPLGMGHFVPAPAGKHQQQNGLSGRTILIGCDGGDKPLRLFSGQKPVELQFLTHLDAGLGLSPARHVPLGGEIVHVSHDHDHTIARSGGIAFLTHARDKCDNRLGGNLVQRVSSGRANMNTQHGFVRTPASLVSFDKGQIFFADEIGQRWNASTFLSARLRVLAKQGLCENCLADATRFFSRQDIGATNLVLSLAATFVAKALIKRLAARSAHFDEKSSLL